VQPDLEFFCRGHSYLAFARTHTGRQWLARFHPEILKAGYAVVPERLAGNLIIEAVARGGLSVCLHP
jgi:hypothetical protein